jgi:excisionase family DNA binding protein
LANWPDFAVSTSFLAVFTNCKWTSPNLSRREVGNVELLLFTVEQCAEALGIGRTNAYELVLKGEISSVKVGRRLVPRWALEKFIRKLEGLDVGDER